MRRAAKASWLDRKIQLAKMCVSGEKIHKESAEQIYVDVMTMFNHARDRRSFSEAAFVERCKDLLLVVSKLRKILDGKQAQDAGALEDALLTYVTQPRAS